MIKKILPVLLAVAWPFLPVRADSGRNILITNGNPNKDIKLELKIEQLPGNHEKTRSVLMVTNHRTQIEVLDHQNDGFGVRDSLKFNHTTEEGYNLRAIVNYPAQNRYHIAINISPPNNLGGPVRDKEYYRFYDIGRWGPIGLFERLFKQKTSSIREYGNGIYLKLIEDLQEERLPAEFPFQEFYQITKVLDETVPGVFHNDIGSKKRLSEYLELAREEATDRLNRGESTINNINQEIIAIR